MRGRVFIDSNILIYAHDLDAGPKRSVAARVLEEVWEEGTGVISTQVLQEFYVNVTCKIPNPLPLAKARGILENYLYWHIETNDPTTVLQASEIEERHRLSFWDALIVASACRARAAKILTEDLNHGQRIEGVLIENPFLDHR
jgi:predicted nucleic acid-binding protein